MNRRHFLTVMGGTTAASIIHTEAARAESTTTLYVKGLVMMSVEDSELLRLGFPKAPGHKATLAVLPREGNLRVMNIRGKSSLQTSALQSSPSKILIPELVSMKEFYGDQVRSRITECPTVISIPYAAIRSVTADELSPSRYTFIRTDNGEEVHTFRPRQIAESIKIDLSSTGTLKLDGGKVSIPLAGTRELHADYSPEANAANNTGDVFADHFHHYLMYVDRPPSANFDVVPKKLAGNAASPERVGNSFYPPFFFCYMVAV